METITAVAAAVYAGPVKSAMEYETALQKVSTIADSTEVPLSTMSSQIMQLSNTTGIAASTIAEDVYNAISAGQKTGDAVNFVTNSTTGKSRICREFANTRRIDNHSERIRNGSREGNKRIRYADTDPE